MSFQPMSDAATSKYADAERENGRPVRLLARESWLFQEMTTSRPKEEAHP